MVSGKILIGTASWSDPGFLERWYPKKLPAGDRLPWYAQHFDLVEVNSTFYSAPEPRMVERWCAVTPDEFTFDVKLHQLFSFHSTPAKLLPPDLQRRVETDAKGKVKPTRDIQEAVLKAFDSPLTEGLASERKSFYFLFATEDQKEGMHAFLEKRKGVFKGR